MIWVVDFGGQTAHLISRRIRDLGSPSLLVEPEKIFERLKKEKPQGIIFSGGPASVYEKSAPTIDKKVFDLKIPSLDICYGLQLRSHLLGGEVKSGTKEYGPVKIKLKTQNSKVKIVQGLPSTFLVWMSHGDSVISMPENFTIIGSSKTVPYAFVSDEKNKKYGVQFHPEIEHTEYGLRILENFINICGVKKQPHKLDPQNLIESIRRRVGDAHVIGAVSGGVDSTVAGTLVTKAIGKQFTPIYVDNGLMRTDAEEVVLKAFSKYGIKPIIIRAEKDMLKRLKGKTDSEEKRKVIGKYYIELFENEMNKLVKKDTDVRFLLQGTIYSDVIESKGTRHASKIKSHHNVGGLPEKMRLELLEPLRELYKDEVRALGEMIGLPHEFVWKQVFPGPGYAIRIRGEVTEKRLSQLKQADEILLDELKRSSWLEKVYMSFPVMTGAQSTAVKGDGRFFGEVIALRVIESKDVMSTKWAHLPYEILQKISSRIVNEVPEISRVVYDITTKPPATMEWE